MAEIGDLVPIDDNNTGRWPEGMPPSNVNNAGRADEGIMSRWHRDTNGSLTSTGTSTAYQLTTNQNLTAYYNGLEITYQAHVACGASPTLQLGALGAANIVTGDDLELAADDIPAGSKINVIYNGSKWVIMNVPSAGNFAILNAQNTFTNEPQTIRQNDDSALAGPSWYLERNRTTPAAGDDLGAIFFDGADSTGANQNWGTMRAEIVDPTNGSHDGQIKFRTAVDAAFGDRFIIAKGMTAGGVTGGDPGFDRLNFFEYFKNGQPLVEFFESTQQTITASTTISVAHGLTAQPQLYKAFLQCTTADAGYAVGDEVEYGTTSATQDTSNNQLTFMNSLYVDNATDVKFSVGGRIALANKSGGGYVVLTLASWRMVLRAWRFSVAT